MIDRLDKMVREAKLARIDKTLQLVLFELERIGRTLDKLFQPTVVLPAPGAHGGDVHTRPTERPPSDGSEAQEPSTGEERCECAENAPCACSEQAKMARWRERR